jgi:hypothetical protein
MEEGERVRVRVRVGGGIGQGSHGSRAKAAARNGVPNGRRVLPLLTDIDSEAMVTGGPPTTSESARYPLTRVTVSCTQLHPLEWAPTCRADGGWGGGSLVTRQAPWGVYVRRPRDPRPLSTPTADTVVAPAQASDAACMGPCYWGTFPGRMQAPRSPWGRGALKRTPKTNQSPNITLPSLFAAPLPRAPKAGTQAAAGWSRTLSCWTLLAPGGGPTDPWSPPARHYFAAACRRCPAWMSQGTGH